MAYYFLNTDAKSLGNKSPHNEWIEYGMAFTGGPMKYGKILGRLMPGDELLMYVSKIGVVAVGKVLEFWDEIQYSTDQLVYVDPYRDDEYRIKVNWYLDLRDRPITAGMLLEEIGWTPVQTMAGIKRDELAIGKLIEDYSKRATKTLSKSETKRKKARLVPGIGSDRQDKVRIVVGRALFEGDKIYLKLPGHSLDQADIKLQATITGSLGQKEAVKYIDGSEYSLTQLTKNLLSEIDHPDKDKQQHNVSKMWFNEQGRSLKELADEVLESLEDKESTVGQPIISSRAVLDMEEIRAEISTRRSRIENELRRVLRDGLHLTLGKKAMGEVLHSIPKERRADIQYHGYQGMWDHMFFLDLINILDSNWNHFQRKFPVEKEKMGTYLDHINKTRKVDAHAGEISAEDLAYLRVCLKRLEELLHIKS